MEFLAKQGLSQLLKKPSLISHNSLCKVHALIGLVSFSLRHLFIQSKTTPNPSSLKFVPGKPVMDSETTMDFSSIRYTHISPLARSLFHVEGVTRVFYGRDYITVTKKDDLDWNVLKPDILSVITDHYSKNQPLFTEEPQAEDTAIKDDDSEAV